MAIVEQLLAEFETPSGQQYRVEYNKNGYIHIHTEHMRIDLTPEEFIQLSEIVIEGRKNLIDVKNDIDPNEPQDGADN